MPLKCIGRKRGIHDNLEFTMDQGAAWLRGYSASLLTEVPMFNPGNVSDFSNWSDL